MSEPSFAVFLRYWFKHGCVNFGGPAGQIALMQHDLVDNRKWIDQTAFLRALNFATLLPGPEAQQLATYVGWRMFGIRGALVAGILFVLPGALVLYALAWIAAAYGHLPPVRAVFEGLQPVVIAVIAFAVFRIGKRTFKGWPPVAMAAAAFAALQFLHVPFPVVVLGAGVIGWLCSHLPTNPFPPAGHGKVEDGRADPASGGWSRAIGLAGVYALLLLLPVMLIVAVFGRALFFDIAVFFTKAAYVTFGGAYAVLPYVAEQAVRVYSWLSPDEMLNGMALAETTPGPLILVLQYVGFFAGWNGAGAVGLSPLAAASIGAALSTYVTFLPSIFFILIGAPYIERIGRVGWAGSALSAITAAVVGVILTLAVFLGAQVIFPVGRVDWIALAATLLTLGVLIRWNLEMHWLVLAGATLGLARMQFAV